jgi:hypothetical protein
MKADSFERIATVIFASSLLSCLRASNYMTLYLTKVWGFGIPSGPLQFGKRGLREHAREILLDGDQVLLVGTKGHQTAEEDQGRLLGIMEPTKEPVMWLDFQLETFPNHFTADGEYKWPYGLLNRRAWTLLDRPLLKDVTSRQFNMDAASGIVPLLDIEERRILGLRRREVELLTPINVLARTEGYETARRRNAPRPTTTRNGVMHVRRAPAYTYVMEIKGASTSAFKIGWAFDYGLRERQFNLYALPDLGGLSYYVRLFQLWATARQAFRMEQKLLRAFDVKRHPGNREVVYGVSLGELKTAWSACVYALRRINSKI